MIAAVVSDNLAHVSGVGLVGNKGVPADSLLLTNCLEKLLEIDITELTSRSNLACKDLHFAGEIFPEQQQKTLFYFQYWNGKTEQRKSIVDQRGVMAVLALNKAAKLSVKIHNQIVEISLEKIHPRLSSKASLVVAELALQVLHVGLTNHQVEVLVQRVQQMRDEFLRVVLLSVLEVAHVFCNDVLESLGVELVFRVSVVIVEKQLEGNDNSSLGPQRVGFVDQLSEILPAENPSQDVQPHETLERAVHVAGVAYVDHSLLSSFVDLNYV